MLGPRLLTIAAVTALFAAATVACGDLVLPDKGGSSGSSGTSSGGSSGTTPSPTSTPTASPTSAPTAFPPPTPGESWSTTAGGCGNVYLYVASASQLHYLVLTADTQALGLAKLGDSATVELNAPGSSGASGHFDTFLSPTSDPPYCTDAPTSHVSSSTPIVSGRMTITITSVPKDTSPGSPYGVDVTLENLDYLRDDGAGYELVPFLQYANVTVGWFAG